MCAVRDTNSTTRNFLNVDEAAEQFEVSTRTIWNWVERGDFPAPLRLGPRWRRWNADELNLWVEQGCPKVTNAN
jgi:excisionase family DNA binding protein